MTTTAKEFVSTDCELMPRLTSTLNGAVRWRWQDFEDILNEQLRLLEAEESEVAENAPAYALPAVTYDHHAANATAQY